MRAHHPSEGVCRICGVLSIRTYGVGPIYVKNGRVIHGHVDCDWPAPTFRSPTFPGTGYLQ